MQGFNIRIQLLYCLVHLHPSLHGAQRRFAAMLDADVLLAHAWNGEPLAKEHGWPLRVVLPKRYAWKGAKWLTGLEFLDHDERGFWETHGYHNDADPFAEERYSPQE